MSELASLWATLLVLAPSLAALVVAGGRLQAQAAAIWSAAASTVSAALAFGLLFHGPGGAVVAWAWAPELSVELTWRLDTATLSLAILVSGIGALVLQYAGSYFAKSADGGRIVALLAAFETAMLGLVLADNLYLLYVFWELTGVCSFFLISSDRSKGEKGLRAASQALLVTVAGGLSLLVAAVYLTAVTGTASLSVLATMDLERGVQTVTLALVLPAVVTKSAQAPMHFWLPGAMAAPTPVSAYLHSATMVKAGIVLLLYLYPVLGESPLWTWSLLPLGAVTCIWGSLRALGEPDIKLLMAWSTVSQLGLLTLTIGLGTDVAIRAAVLHLFAHAVFKAGLFLTVGAIDHAAHSRSLLELGGLGRRAPILAVIAAILAASMAGIPPLAGFLSKELILKKAMLAEFWVHAVAISAIVLGAIGTVAYSSRFFFEVFAGQPRSRGAEQALRPGLGLLFAPGALAALTLLSGPAARWVDLWFLEPVAFSVVGAPLEFKPLSLWYGVSAAFVLSVVIASTGYLADRLMGLRFLGPRSERWPSGPELFERLMDAAQRLGRWAARALTAAPPRAYLALALVLGLLPAGSMIGGAAAAGRTAASLAGLTVVAALAVLLATLLIARRRLPRVLLLTAVGFSVAMLFRLMNGPDLMLTQLLVEILVTIFFALALGALPATASGRASRELPTLESAPSTASRRDRWRWGRLLLAGACALAAATLVPAIIDAPRSDHVATFAREVAPVVAKGDNLVNVVLTDMRSLDTLMETLVVVLGTLAVVGLLRGRERADRDPVARPDAASATCRGGLLPGMVKVILPIGFLFALVLLIKGHNDPGGGFVAGLSLGVTAMLALIAFGSKALHRRLPASFGGLAILGIVTMLATGAIGMMVGKPFLTQFHGYLPLPGEIPWHSTLLFDIGVMLAVAGGIGAAGVTLWSMRRSSREPQP